MHPAHKVPALRITVEGVQHGEDCAYMVEGTGHGEKRIKQLALNQGDVKAVAETIIDRWVEECEIQAEAVAGATIVDSTPVDAP